jgi:uncharacterized protein (TIGR02391 family)
MVTDWTGGTACVLQAALRVSNQAFAELLGVGIRTVATWHQKPTLRPRPETQQLLDTALEHAPDAARARFAVLAGDPAHSTGMPQLRQGLPGALKVNDENGHRPTALKPAREISADLLDQYERRIIDPDLRAATRSRFVTQHYADAVEAGVKVLNQYVRSRTGRTEDGDELMKIVFHPNGMLLRVSRGKSKSDESAQRGHMLLCQGVVAAWRNPRAHALTEDQPRQALMMLELIGDLLRVTRAATRTRKRKKA